jgi:uncharacterized protein (TIGR01244 family)
MQTIKISDHLSVSAQPSLGEFQGFRDKGFAAVVNARPDQEEPGQPGNAAERDAAEHAGLSYSFIPVAGSIGPGRPVRRAYAICGLSHR